jgi:long-subunit fatty acid transport protein
MSRQSNVPATRYALLAALWCAALCAARAQELEIAISPSPVGSGARAAGMADAFVALADDATAASWNPAGLVQLERPELSIVGAYNGLFEWFSADFHDEVDSRPSSGNLDLNFLSVTYPLPVLILGRNSSVGLYYQRKYDFSRQFTLEFDHSTVSPRDKLVLNVFDKLDFEQEGGLSTITAAFAFELTKRLSLGVAANFWRSTPFAENGWKQTMRRQTFAQRGTDFSLNRKTSEEEYKDFTGENLTLGLLWNVSNKWNIGARYDSAFTGNADFTARSLSFTNNLSSSQTGNNRFQLIPGYKSERRDVRFPATWALGAAYRPNKRLTLSWDVTTTDWNEFYFKDSAHNRISLVNAGNFDQVIFPPKFNRTYTVRFGSEYVFVPKIPEETLNRLWTVRGGVYYDQEAASNEPDNFWGATAGIGLQLFGRINIDAAYQARWGNDVNSDFIRGIHGFDEDVMQHRFLLSTVIYF